LKKKTHLDCPATLLQCSKKCSEFSIKTKSKAETSNDTIILAFTGIFLNHIGSSAKNTSINQIRRHVNFLHTNLDTEQLDKKKTLGYVKPTVSKPTFQTAFSISTQEKEHL
jgi:hypothetical protein